MLKGRNRTAKGIDRPAPTTRAQVEISDHVIQGQTMLPGGRPPAEASMIMSKTKLAAYAPTAATTNVAIITISPCDLRRAFRKAFPANDRPVITTAINRNLAIGVPS
jgi:hypothetical protein